MNASRKLLALSVAGLISAMPMVGVINANAANTNNPETEVVAQTKDPVAHATSASVIERDGQILRTVDDSYRALRAVRAARLAIFNGTPEHVAKLVGDASKDLQAAQLNARDFAVPTAKSSGGDTYIPFDMSMALAEGFVPTQDKQATLEEANAHFGKGDHKQAAEVLKLANIEVTVSAALLPVNASLAHVKDAQMLIGEKKYYEANLALKAIEDGAIIESYSIDAVPAQGAGS